MLAVRIPDLPTWVWIALIPVAMAAAGLYWIYDKHVTKRIGQALRRDLGRRGFALLGFRRVRKEHSARTGSVMLTKYDRDKTEYLVSFRDAEGLRLKARAEPFSDGSVISFRWTPRLDQILTSRERNAAAGALEDLADG